MPQHQKTVAELTRECADHVETFGFTRIQVVTFAWCCLVWICSNSLVGTAIPVISKGLVADLELSTQEMSILQAVVACGAVAGGFVCAEILERFGRRNGITIICVCTIFTLVTLSLLHNFWLALLCQFCLGIISCTETLAVKIFLSEVLPQSGKGFWMNIVHISYQVCCVLRARSQRTTSDNYINLIDIFSVSHVWSDWGNVCSCD
mgnify:CR=1 FL=1